MVHDFSVHIGKERMRITQYRLAGELLSQNSTKTMTSEQVIDGEVEQTAQRFGNDEMLKDEPRVLCRSCGGGKLDRGIEERRTAVLDEADELLCTVEQETGAEVDHVKQDLNIARENLLNDGEYNYCVRSALVFLENVVECSEDGQIAILECIEEFRDRLAQKAALPPRSQ
ncbi:hypothetical protein [Halohasta litorea]|uniref:Uncharacterized protein n=1 Tax=Halohasta litorea TaxID=869891 RepID=A0ABD6D6A2_9EURY|nr:hypothetical protein [Halohasta litorea]